MGVKPIVALEARAAGPLWRNVSFLLMWSSVAASGFGDRMIQLAAWTMLGYRAPEAQVSSITASVSFFFFLPYVLFGPVAGWIADTLPRKWLMLFCDEARAGILLLAFLIAPAGAAAMIPSDHHWKVYAIIFAVGLLAAVFSPAKAATVPQIVPTRQLQPANAIILGIAVIASMIGLMVGGPIIDKGSLHQGLGLAVACFAVSGTFFAFLKLRASGRSMAGPKTGQIRRLIEAVGYIRRHRPVLILTVLSMLFWAAGHTLLAAIAALCKDRYGIEPSQLLSKTSVMMATLGIGMLASSLWVAWIGTRRESSWFALACLLVTGGSLVAIAMSRSYQVGLVLTFGCGFFGNAAMICIATLTQLITPNYIRGRVFGVRDLAITLTSVVINFAIWRMPGADGFMIPALCVAAVLLLGVSAIGLFVAMTAGPHPGRALNATWRVCRAYTLVWHRLTWIGRHHVPSSGPVILAANHTTGLDPAIIQSAVPRAVRWVMYSGYRFRLLDPLWRMIQPITVDQDGSDLAQLRQTLRHLHSNDVIGIFPEGGAQRADRVLKPFEPGVSMLAKRSGATIVPVWIYGTPQTQSMLWHFLKPSRTTVVFGPGFVPDPGMGHQEVADALRERMVAMAVAAGFEVG